jgi:RimJ/RimL family protein N-acetyltransferase
VNLQDSEKYTEWINDLKTSVLINGASDVIDVKKEEQLLEQLIKSETDRVFVIITKESNQLIGNIGLHKIDLKNRHATLGIFIGDEDFLNQGLGTEAIKLLLSYGFYFLNLHNIDLEVFSYNQRAIQCYESIGFKEIGRRRESVILGNKFYDKITMDILSSEFDSQYDNFVEQLNEV